jgi:NOL1/NOP2/fmu family ribosome biogenesis protein
MSDRTPANDGQQFDRLPAATVDRDVAGRPTREEIIQWWDNRFGIPPTTWDHHTLWEKGNGKIWAVAAEYVSPIPIEGVGLRILRTRQEHWKPSTNAAQRFGVHASKNVLTLDHEEAVRFADGTDQPLPRWDGDWGYLIVAHEIAGVSEPIGVGLYLHDELRSTVPKGRREDLS